jgi:hypothetical protein
MLLTQNGKMKKTAKATGIHLYNFGIPAFRSVTGTITCPMALHCISGCYARCGTYGFSNVKNAYERRLKATQNPNFHKVMSAEILSKWYSLNQGEKLFIRIHDSGDFYDETYLKKWILIMLECPEVQFYAYTKMVRLFKMLQKFGALPKNFTVIYSYGGKEDSLIDPVNDRHSKVFESIDSLNAAGYADGTDNDMVAASGASNLIGLVYHGVKNYSNTTWSKV